MDLHSEKGFTGIDIAVSVVIIFLFISIIASLIYNVNSKSREIELKTEAIYIAINEIEQIKNDGYEKYGTLSRTDGNNVVCSDQEIEGQEGYYKTIEVIDYTDLEGNQDKVKNIVKKATVKISYMFKAKEQSVEISTILTKE